MIILTTVNARFSHAAFGIRSLRANLGEWRSSTQLMEFTLEDRATDIAEKLLAQKPVFIGFSVYIWNVALLTEVVHIIKSVAPRVTLALGGPEVSYEAETQAIVQSADFVLAGAGEFTLPALLQDLYTHPTLMANGENAPLSASTQKFIPADPRALHKLDQLILPDAEYTEEDLRHRHIYFEASRGCPFKCEFCLSSLDVSAFAFPLENVLASLDRLWARGLRRVKFVDRTFNLAPKISSQILDWFLHQHAQTGEPFFAHFEMIPDRLPAAIRERLQQFPPGSLQLEIGIQSWNVAVQTLISRKQDNDKTEENLRFLTQETHAHLHTDLIMGLPGETLESFAAGFSRLWRLGVAEIQVGLLKRLRGTPIQRHTEPFAMVYDRSPPYALLQNRDLDFVTLQRLNRFARFWDLIGNSGRFTQSLTLILNSPEPTTEMHDSEPFWRFFRLAEGIYHLTGKTHQFSVERLFDLVFQVGCESLILDKEALRATLSEDYQNSGARGNPKFLDDQTKPIKSHLKSSTDSTPKRQQRHLQGELG